MTMKQCLLVIRMAEVKTPGNPSADANAEKQELSYIVGLAK
jgi:hypothetical protein